MLRYHCIWTVISGTASPKSPDAKYPLQVTTTNLEKVRKQKTRHQRLFNRVQTVREELQRFLEDDDDMIKMCLTRKKELENPTTGKRPSKLPLSTSLHWKARTLNIEHLTKTYLCHGACISQVLHLFVARICSVHDDCNQEQLRADIISKLAWRTDMDCYYRAEVASKSRHIIQQSQAEHVHSHEHTPEHVAFQRCEFKSTARLSLLAAFRTQWIWRYAISSSQSHWIFRKPKSDWLRNQQNSISAPR